MGECHSDLESLRMQMRQIEESAEIASAYQHDADDETRALDDKIEALQAEIKALKGRNESVTTYYAVHVEQDDKRPVLVCKYKEFAETWGHQTYDALGVKWFSRPIEIPNNLLLYLEGLPQ